MGPDSITQKMMETTENWKKVTRYVEEVIKDREEEERSKEKADQNRTGN